MSGVLSAGSVDTRAQCAPVQPAAKSGGVNKIVEREAAKPQYLYGSPEHLHHIAGQWKAQICCLRSVSTRHINRRYYQHSGLFRSSEPGIDRADDDGESRRGRGASPGPRWRAFSPTLLKLRAKAIRLSGGRRRRPLAGSRRYSSDCRRARSSRRIFSSSSSTAW